MSGLQTVTLALALTAAVQAADLLPNPGFEGGFDENGAAMGWLDNSSWANLDVAYAQENRNLHSGEACQRIACTRLDTGAIQMIPAVGLALKRDRIYRVRAWLRGDVGLVAVQLRLAPAPYTVYVEEHLAAGPEWSGVEYLWTSNVDDSRARFMIRFTQTGTLWLDDLSVEEVSLDDVRRDSGPAPRGNLLHNGDLDLGLANWLVSHGCDYWTEAKLSTDLLDGEPCLKVEMPEGVWAQVSSDVVKLTPGHRVWTVCRVRAAEPTQVTISTLSTTSLSTDRL